MIIDKINAIFKKIHKILEKIIVTFDIIAMAAIVVIIFAQVISRYIFNASLSWSEELSKYITVWIVFLSTGYVLGIKQHVSIDLIFGKLPKKAQFYLSKVFTLIYAFFCYVIIRSGITFTELGVKVTGSSIQIPLMFVYCIVPITGFIMLFYTVLLFFERREKEE